MVYRGRRYGLCGGNGVGKSTLMRAISRGQLEGFPPPDKLKTVYVEHDIQVLSQTGAFVGTINCLLFHGLQHLFVWWHVKAGSTTLIVLLLYTGRCWG
jgi:hypothetical protein